MAEKTSRRPRGTDWLGIASFGLFVLLIGAVWVFTPGLTIAVQNFVLDFELQNVTSNISLPAPANVQDHTAVYMAAMEFCVVFGVFHVVVLALRFVFHDHIDRKADAVSGMAFWFCAAYFTNLLYGGSIGWFSFIAGVVISGGVAIIASSVVKLFR